MDPELAEILADLDRHKDLFDLSGDLGDDALDIATNGVKDHFDAEVDPQGQRWPELSTDYSRWKQKNHPGPMGVLHGLMKGELDGERAAASRDSAEYTAGTSDDGRNEISWFEEGDPEANRPARKFVDLNAESIGKSDRLFDDHFDKGTS